MEIQKLKIAGIVKKLLPNGTEKERRELRKWISWHSWATTDEFIVSTEAVSFTPQYFVRTVRDIVEIPLEPTKIRLIWFSLEVYDTRATGDYDDPFEMVVEFVTNQRAGEEDIPPVRVIPFKYLPQMLDSVYAEMEQTHKSIDNLLAEIPVMRERAASLHLLVQNVESLK